MHRRYGPLTRIILLGILLIGVASNSGFAQLTFSATPGEATANSVWNLLATWRNGKGIWPSGKAPGVSGGLITEGHIDYGGLPSESGNTIGQIRPPLVTENQENVWFPQLLAPKGFVGFPSLAGKTAFEENQGLGWLWVQPDPAPKISGEKFTPNLEANDRGRFDAGLDYFEETIPIGAAPLPEDEPVEVEVSTTSPGQLLSKFIHKREALTGDPDADPPTEDRPETPAVIVTRYSPIWIVEVLVDGIPANAEIANASTLYPDTGGWPDVNVILLTQDVDWSTKSSFVVKYYGPGSKYAVTQRSPLPLPYTVYPLNTSAPNLDRVKFNPEILNLDIDTNKRNPVSWDVGLLGAVREGDAASGLPGNPLLGIYNSPDLETADEPENYAQYFEVYDDELDSADKLAILLTTALPPGAHDPDPDEELPYNGDKVWVRFVQRATVTGTTATLENGAIIKSIQGIYANQQLTGRNYYAGGFQQGDSVAWVTGPEPLPSPMWVDCRAQFRITAEGRNDTVISETPFSTMFADSNDNRYAMYNILGVFLDESATGTNYFLPYEAPNTDHPNYSVMNLPLAKKPGETWPTLYFKVRSYAVEKATANEDGTGANLCNPSFGGAYDGKLGLLRLNTSGSTLPAPSPHPKNGAFVEGQKVYVWYSPLSRTTLTPGNATPGTLRTPDDNVLGLQAFTDPGGPIEDYSYSAGDLAVAGQNKFVLKTTSQLPANTTSVQMDMNMREPDNNGQGVIWCNGVPLYYVEGNPIIGATYRGAASAGLNLSYTGQQPSIDWLDNRPLFNNRLIYDPRGRPMSFLPLVANPDGSPREHELTASAHYIDMGQWQTTEVSTTVTVHDSSPGGIPPLVNYAGQALNLDYLTCYPDNFGGGSWPQGYDVDPLQVEPIEHANTSAPDDGSSSTQFVFRVRYHNRDGLPPLPWLHEADDPWWPSSSGASGVVLYLDERGTGDYRPHFMQLERPDLEPGDADYAKYEGVYIYRVIPHNSLGYRGDPEIPPFQMRSSDYLGTFYDNNLYSSLACGTYHYFFACSDDSLHFDGGSLPFENQSASGRLQWGEQVASPVSISWPARNSTGLDPSLPRTVAGLEEMNRAAQRRYSSDGGASSKDRSVYVDRPVRVPGYYEGNLMSYPWPSEFHPRVTCALHMPSADSQGVRYDDRSYGYGRFFGTLTPFYRASNPVHPGTRIGGGPAALAETSGATTKTDITFRIMWKQIDNKPPVRIQVLINNASERTGSTAGHTYTAYTMTPSPGQTQPYNYRTGVWYEYKTKLPAGPHTYRFEAFDGEHTVRYPVRPDRYNYDLPGQGGSISDWWVPTESLATERALPGYIDNDYIPGPYVNNACVLSQGSVSPGTGKEGQNFRYRVRYSDPDGQRIYSAFVYIKINARGDVRKFAMLPEVPILDPENDHSQDYKNGVWYYLDTGTVGDLSLEPGVRQFYFEFTDDWGRQGDINDLVQGETTRLPAGDGNWIDGPVINKNVAPTLSRGSVESQDGTANAATLWTYRVNYRDLNNDAPSLVKVYIGLLQPDGKTILWNEGYTMLPDDPGDSVYIDGKSYYFQTRLGGVDAVDPSQESPDPKQYYYAFVAYDGLTWATYKSSAKDEERSNAAGCMVMQDLVSSGDGIHFEFKPILAQRAAAVAPAGGGNIVDVTPASPLDIVRVHGVYLTENLSADTNNPQTYYDPNLDTNVFKPGSTTIKLASTLPNGTVVDIRYVSTKKAVRSQLGTVVVGNSVDPSDLGDILRVISVTTEDDPYTNLYNPFKTIRLNVGAGLPAGTAAAWIQYEGQTPVIGPLPIDLPPPAGIIPDAQIYEDYTSFPFPIRIDGQKNGWVSPIDPTDRATIFMPGRCVFDGQPTSQYVTPDDARTIASVEGVYLKSDLSGRNYVQTQVWEVDPTDATRKTVRRVWRTQDPLATRLQKVYGVYTDPDLQSENYYNPYSPAGTDGYKLDLLTQVGSASSPASTATAPNPGAVESIIGIFQSQPADAAAALALPEFQNFYAFDHLAVQRRSPTLVVKPDIPSQVKSVLGVYFQPDLSGTNYYDPAAAGEGYVTGDKYIEPTTRIMGPLVPDEEYDPDLIPRAWVQYVNLNNVADPGDDTVEIARWPVVGGFVALRQPDPIKQVLGVYDNSEFTGTNYYDPTKASPLYAHGDGVVELTDEMPATTFEAHVRYESLGFGFGPDSNRVALNRPWEFVDLFGNPQPLYMAYFTGGRPVTTYDTKGQPVRAALTLSQAVPAGVDKVYVHVAADSFSSGDTAVRLVDDLYDTDDKGLVIAPRVVKPTDSTKIGGVIGVYRSKADAESADLLNNPLNLYAGTEAPFNVGDTVIRLKSSINNPPAVGTDNLYIVYVPKKVYVKYSGIRFTHQVQGMSQQTSGTFYYTAGSTHFTPNGWNATIFDRNLNPQLNVFIKSNLEDRAVGTDRDSDAVNSGIVGIWNNPNRDRTNFFDPKKATRFSRDPLHQRLTTNTPLGTTSLWARYYQRGEYHLDRWNGEATFLAPRTGRMQASYFFGTKMPFTIGPNTAPQLLAGTGKVTPLYGSSTTQFVFNVTYRDLDGPNGQAPAYVRVYVDGTPYEMTPVVQGTPPYREGAVFTCTLPQGLSGGSHKYHFEASDGSALAWYDANGSHQSLVGAIVESIVDIDGPWINDPPQLADGYATPNPATGGINPWDSVDYFVTYYDADNEEPYTYDPARDTSSVDLNANGIPDVIENSGSPRVWIDSGAVDIYLTGTVAALEADPVEAGKMRTIVVEGSPGWIPDQFAGKLMQITNGALTGRVYLIQSNTANKMVIATNDLAVDGVIAGGTNPSRFRINGLLMSKANPAQQDFTRGVVYKITVPKLAVGNHKFHFTARSRETKPQWLISQLPADQQVPFSALVRFPQGADANGPNVISTPPPGNVAPVIMNSLATSLYVGPRDQLVSVLNLNEVAQYDASLWSMIREVRGVFINANDFSVNQLTSTDEEARSYYNPRTASPAYASGDTKIVLTKALPTVVPGSLVGYGAVTGDEMTAVTPDNPGAIGQINGVYLTSDPTFAGTNYFRSSDGTQFGSFDGATITLPRPLPSGTKRVYVAFNLAAGKGWSSVPVYVKYFSERSPEAFKTSDLVTFRINYRDGDGDPPNYHDNVQGFVKVVFNGLNLSYQMRPLNPPAAGVSIDYRNDVLFTSEPVTLPQGSYKYHFEASDGYFNVRYPTGVLGDPTANDYPIQVNYKPIILSAEVEPTTGQPATTFTFRATYRDSDGVSTKQPRVVARISRVDGQGSEIIKEMTPATTNYMAGAQFSVDIVPRDMVPPLAAGIYKVVFEATDPDGEDADPYPAPGQPDMTFTVRAAGTNRAPEIVSASAVNRVTDKPYGKLNDFFIYKAQYRDADGDAPLGEDGRTRDVLTVYVDKGTANQMKLTLVKAPGAPSNPTPGDYMAGVDFQLASPISGQTLGGGQHTFEVNASDGISSAVPFQGEGPLLLIPFFENFRLVSKDAANPATAPAVTTGVVGDQVLVVGNLSFPRSGDADTTPPIAVDNIAVRVQKPDGTQLTLEASTMPVNWTGPLTVYYQKAQNVDPAFATGDSITLTASGDWVVSASWPGNTIWDRASTEGRDATVFVGGPLRTIAVADPSIPATSTPLVDMITPPRIIGSSDPGRIFGFERALDMRIVRWMPALGGYVRYDAQGNLADLQPGEAIWIKPKPAYPADSITQAQIDSGLLASGNRDSSDNDLPLDPTKSYRLIQTFVKDYTRNQTTGLIEPCEIQLRAGWNQFGNIFMNWKKTAGGSVILPRQDVGLPFSEVKVRYLNETKTLAQAAAAGWIRDYAWGYDASGRRYVPVSASAAGADRVLRGWRGYWIRAFLDCKLIIDPNTTYNGLSLPAVSTTLSTVDINQFDAPPPIPE